MPLKWKKYLFQVDYRNLNTYIIIPEQPYIHTDTRMRYGKSKKKTIN